MRFLLISTLLVAFNAQAQIYECVDASGNKVFTNIKSQAKGCRALDVGPVNTVPAFKPPAKTQPAPTNFPKVDASTQRERDADRRRILEQELGNEQKELAAAPDAGQGLAVRDRRIGGERLQGRERERREPLEHRAAERLGQPLGVGLDLGQLGHVRRRSWPT